MSNSTSVILNQSLFDISIQQTGSIEGIIEMAVLNNIAITDELKPGTALQYGEMNDTSIAAYYKSNGVKPATGTNNGLNCLFDGIGYMIIEQDFIVGAKCATQGVGKMIINQTFNIN